MIRRHRAAAALGRLALVALLALVVGAVALPRLAYGQQTGTIVATVVAKGTDAALGYSVVSIEALTREQFTDAGGRTVLNGLPPGHWTVRAKHIGFLPIDQAVDIRAGDTLRLRLELAPVAVLLPPVRTVATTCTKPGAPLAQDDPDFAVLFDQVKQNAERNRLITRSYPYQFASERVQARRHANGTEDTVSVLSQTSSSEREWRYRAGNIVQRVRVGTTMTVQFMLPDLADFADDEFIRNHCFRYSGVQDVPAMQDMPGARLLRVDFEASTHIRDPDISGSFYLDTATYQLRRADLRMTNAGRGLTSGITGLSVTTLFQEVVPGVPLMSEVISESTLPVAHNRDPWVADLTYQHAIGVIWLRARP